MENIIADHQENISSLVVQAVNQKNENSNGHSAFTKIVNLYSNQIFHFLFTRIFDEHTAADLTQEVFLIAFNKLESLQNPCAIGAWLRAIAKHEIIRFRMSRSKIEITNDNFLCEQTPSPFNAPDITLERSEFHRIVTEAVDTLSASNKEVVHLFYFLDYPIKAVAGQLELNETTVKKRLQRSREYLREEMKYIMNESMDLTKKSEEYLSGINLSSGFEQAASLGQICFVEEMLVDGIDVNGPDIKGQTLLHCAAAKGLKDVVDLLIRSGADISLKDKTGKTPSDCAEEAGFFSLAEKLKGTAGIET